MKVGRADEDVLDSMFQICLCRRPTIEEKARLLELIREQRQAYQGNVGKAAALVGGDVEDSEVMRRATWATVARVLMNLDEFITRE
jgi:hypothetical protein